MAQLVRWQLIFHGTVQNVGFRYEMTRLARHYGLSGWVMNHRDGSVEAHVQGTETNIRLMLEELTTIDHIHVTEVVKTPLPLCASEQHFVTRFDD